MVYDPNEEIFEFASSGVEVIGLIDSEPSIREIKLPRYGKFRDVLFDRGGEGNLEL